MAGLTPPKCPECDSPIYCRRHKHCGVCGASLPEHLLFSEAEAMQITELLRIERQQHRAWMRRD